MKGRRRVVRSLAGAFALSMLASSEGFAAASAAPSSVMSLKQLNLEDLINLEVTSVSKRSERLLETASAIQVVTGEEIRRSGASSIPDALRLASNLDVSQENAHEWVISARGFNSDVGNKLLVLIDGRAVYSPLFSGVFWDRQDYLLEDIDQIEVISGPGGTLWGANAVNGVINITTKRARDTPGLYVEAGGGTGLQGFTGVRYGGTLAPNVSYRIYGKLFERASEVMQSGTEARDSWRMGQGGIRVDAEPDARNTVTVQGDFYRIEKGIPTGGTSTTTGGNLLGRWSRVFSDGSDASLKVYYDRTDLTLPVPSLLSAPAGTFQDTLDTWDVEFQHRFEWDGRNRFVWGLGYRLTHDVVKNAPALAFFPPTLDQNLFNGFVQDEITLMPKTLNLTLGTKVEHNDYTGFEIEPGGRLQWKVTSRQMLWAAVSRAVRTPSRIDRDLSQPAPGYVVVILQGGRDFASESVVAYELGYRTQLGERAAVSLSGFFNEYRDVRSTTTSPRDPVRNLPFPFFFENNLEGETCGLEFHVSYQALEHWRLDGGYSLLKEDIRIKPGRADFNNARNETADVEQRFSIRSSVDLHRNVEFNTAWRWVDIRHGNRAGAAVTVPSYFELDVRLGWQASEHLELSVVGRNLLHDRHPEFGAPGPNRVEIGRSFYGKAVWRF